MSADRVTYVDSSAIVKLVVAEPESSALRKFLKQREPLVSSALARVEVMRALLPAGNAVTRRGHEVLRRIDLIRINDRVLDTASAIEPYELRTLDAIHLATVGRFGDTLEQIVTYDQRMAAAAQLSGWTVVAPA